MKKLIPHQKLGFALIATILMMVLLGILTIGTLSLSTIAVRSTNHDAALGEARANARMALMIAIGQLQEHTGPDTRITAPADIIEDNAPRVTGVWKSWEGTNHDSTGRPIKPDYTVKTKGKDQSGRFITWLVSGAEAGGAPLAVPPTELVSTSASSVTVPLLGEGSLGSNTGQVHVKPQLLEDNKGAYAWWVSPENQKARLTTPYEPSNTTAVGWSDLAKSHAVPDPEPFGLENILDDPESYIPDSSDAKPVSMAVSLDTTQLLATDASINPQQNFHDMSVTSVGLLTNSATGGWRKDMSILTERWSNLPSTNLPLFRILPQTGTGSTTLVTKATTTAPTAAQSIFYPWSGYPGPSPGAIKPAERHGAVSSWNALIDYATSYKTITYNSSTGVASTPLKWAKINRQRFGPSTGNVNATDLFNHLHTVRKAPVLARVQWIFRFRSKPRNPALPTTTYDIFLSVTPVYTLWNPYNVAIQIPDNYAIVMQKAPPVAIAIYKEGTVPAVSSYRRYITGSLYDLNEQPGYDSSLPNNYAQSWEQTNGQGAGLPANITLAPGESKVYSLASDTATGNTGIMGVLKEGYDGTNAYGFVRLGTTGTPPVTAPVAILNDTSAAGFRINDKIRFAMRFDNKIQLTTDPKYQGPGIRMDVGSWLPPGNPNRYVGDVYTTYTTLTSLDYSQAYWSQPTDLPAFTMTQINPDAGAEPWTPAFSIVFGPRLTIGSGVGNQANRPTKGLLQNSPLVTSVLTTSESKPTNHPANGAFDFLYFGHQLGGSPTLPDDGSVGYILSGNNSSKGLSRLVLSELPLRPIASLVELQGWDLRAHNQLPPFQYNIIGNSDAVPMIPQDNVIRADAVTADLNFQHDDAYCANHLLFDDWFFSSIAPEPQNFGSNTSKTIDVVYREFLKGEHKLVNRAYRPISEDSGISDADATTRIGQIINSSDGWQKVASRFEVDGMFNVNSTSVKAWRALLGHARNKKVPHHTASGMALSANEEDHAVTRYTVASDIEASEDSGMSGSFSNSSQYTGYRKLTDAQLDELAEKIVEQVRLRGPFLSLSEFVNRQLSDDDDLALAGTIQTALNSLTANPNAPLKNTSYASATMSSSDSKLDGADYAFPEAAVGHDTFGLPGWIRQADILRPLAPILSARDDTFTIRAYGDSRDVNGNVVARVWCEATVRRSRDFVDTTDSADSINPPAEQQNVTYGRRYEISRFRWLNANEV